MKNSLLTKKTTFALLCASSAVLLQACGGGGSDGPPASSAASAGSASGSSAVSNSGTVSAPFKAGANPRYQLAGNNSFKSGPATSITQDASGAVTKLGENTLTGQTAVQEINGDASFAIGRWAAGTVTTSTGADTLSATDNRIYHYVLYNALAAFPESGSFNCDAGTFTAPTRDSGSAISPTTGSASGQASLSFTGKVATVSGSVAVSAGSSKASVPLNAGVKDPASSIYTGAYFNNGTGAGVQVADAGNGAYQLVGTYRAMMADGTGYIGMYRFLCK